MEFLRLIFYFFNNLRINIFTKKVRVSLSCKIKPKSELKGYNRISKKTYVNGVIGKYSYIGPFCVIDAYIGNYCSIGPHVEIITGTHPLYFVSTSPFFFAAKQHFGIEKMEQIKFDSIAKVAMKRKEYGCIIGNDVWIGADVLIKGGCRIGDGAIVGMGSVVTKDVPPYAVVGGNPAKIIKYRFDKETIDLLMQIKWWNFSAEEIKKYIRTMGDVNEFVELYKNSNKTMQR